MSITQIFFGSFRDGFVQCPDGGGQQKSRLQCLWLIVTFFAISGHYILLNAQFLAIVNIIVYAGAIMVLFLFVIMLMNLNKETEPKKTNG